MKIYRIMQGKKEIARYENQEMALLKKNDLQNQNPKRKYNVEIGFKFDE